MHAMEHPAVDTTLCERCSLLGFDDLATGGREVIDEEGVPRLSFEDAEMEWRSHNYREKQRPYIFKLIRLRWHLDDSLPHLPQLSNSSRSGCDFCNSLRHCLKIRLGILSRSHSIHDGPISLTAYIPLHEEGIEGFVVESIYDEIEGEERSIRALFPIEASPGCQKWLGAEPTRHDDYLTSENINEMCRVLAECTANCHPWEASFLPTRLIDVGTSLSDIPRLVSSSDSLIPAETKYAALSYCWGDKEDAEAQLKTETATLEQRFKGIPCEIMTPAIKDAVDLTRAIGLRYIWIDALCIVQDDTTDWSYESGQMNRVYHSAFVTFCGLASTSCHQSFLQRGRTVTIPFQSTLRPNINGHLLVRLQPLLGDWPSRDIYTHDSRASGWNSRAWTYQEERLSTRLLLFGASKMHFRCGTHQWSEDDNGLSRLNQSTISIHDRITGIKQGKSPASSLYETWNLLVHDYSHRWITHETDRLPALSGLARLVGETLGDDYLAGLWKGDVLNGLAWTGLGSSYGLQNHLQIIRQREYIAPSWSWASYKSGGIWNGYPGWQTVFECTLLGFDVKNDLQNPFGRVYGGYLRIRGKVASVPSSLRKGSRNDEWSRKWQLKFGGVHQDVLARLDWLQRDEEEGLENLIMLLLHYQQPPEQPLDETRGRDFRALMLYPTETPDEYYRVGVVQSSGQAASDLMRTWFEYERNEKICTII